MKVITTELASHPLGHYAQAVEHNGTVFVSGQLPVDAETQRFVDGSIQEQAKQVVSNINALLQAAGFGKHHVVSCNIFLTDINDIQFVDEVLVTFFEQTTPARTVVQVAKLPKDANVQISCIAVL